MAWKDRKVIYISLIISVILHIVILISMTDMNLFAFTQTPKVEEPAEPVELVFEKPVSMPSDQIPEKFYELKENPNASGKTPENADILSSESSLSQAPVIAPGKLQSLPGNQSETSQNKTSKVTKEDIQKALDKSMLAYRENQTFNRSALTGQEQQNQQDQQDQEKSGSTKGETSINLDEFDAKAVGDFALSTYKWEWFPYMMLFKNKLQRVWYAPPAYSQLGLISGYTIARFKITRDGRLIDLQVLRQVGHESLQLSSVSALEAVTPLPPLPDNFPDEYLEITVKMIYPDLRAYTSGGQQE
jgi:outer membrane biosynthesis protein TonB